MSTAHYSEDSKKHKRAQTMYAKGSAFSYEGRSNYSSSELKPQNKLYGTKNGLVNHRTNKPGYFGRKSLHKGKSNYNSYSIDHKLNNHPEHSHEKFGPETVRTEQYQVKIVEIKHNVKPLSNSDRKALSSPKGSPLGCKTVMKSTYNKHKPKHNFKSTHDFKIYTSNANKTKISNEKPNYFNINDESMQSNRSYYKVKNSVDEGRMVVDLEAQKFRSSYASIILSQPDDDLLHSKSMSQVEKPSQNRYLGSNISISCDNKLASSYNTYDPERMDLDESRNDKFSDVKSTNILTPRGSSNSFVSFKRKGSVKSSTRSANRQRLDSQSVLKIGPEAFEQPDDEEQDIEIYLEDILKEEQIIFQILQNVKGKDAYHYEIKNWWNISTQSCSSQVQLFEGDNSKKLIRQYQIAFIMVLGYLECIDSLESLNFKTYSSLKNILNNVHSNYLVFVRFIYKNLSDDQKYQTKDICDQIQKVINDRPTNKSQLK